MSGDRLHLDDLSPLMRVFCDSLPGLELMLLEVDLREHSAAAASLYDGTEYALDLWDSRLYRAAGVRS